MISSEEPDSGDINALFASIESSVPEVDVVGGFTADFLRHGLGGMGLSNPEGIAHLKQMYSAIWDRIAGRLLSPQADWRREPVPLTQLENLLGATWDLQDDEELKDVALVGFMLAFMDDHQEGVWGEIFGSSSYFGKSEMERTVEAICREGNLRDGDGPESFARFTMNFVYTTYATWAMGPDHDIKDKQAWLAAIRSQVHQ